MKKIINSIVLVIIVFSTFAQTNHSNSILVRHDTTLLKSEECEWLIKSLIKNDPSLTSEIGKPVPLIIMEAIQKGKLKAIDPQTNKPIPAKDIFTWKMGSDTMPVYDNEGNITKYQALQRLHSSDNFNQIRIYQDWYFNVSTGKFSSVIKWIELVKDIHTESGSFIGHAIFCRIYY